MLLCNDPRYLSKIKSIIRGYVMSGLVSMATINDIKKLKEQGGVAFLEGVPPLLAAAGVDPLPPCARPFTNNTPPPASPPVDSMKQVRCKRCCSAYCNKLVRNTNLL